MAGISPTIDGSAGSVNPQGTFIWGWSETETIGWDAVSQIGFINSESLTGLIGESVISETGTINPT